jgi:hypothetical protein
MERHIDRMGEDRWPEREWRGIKRETNLVEERERRMTRRRFGRCGHE